MGIPQTSYSVDPAVAFLPGMPARPLGNGDEVVHYVASEDIRPGCLLEVVNGQVREAQATSSLKPLAGVAIRLPTHTNTSFTAPLSTYRAGQQVAVLRKGRIYANWSGTTQPELGAVNYKHSSTTATTRGFFTDSGAAVTTAGSEQDPAGNGVLSVKSTGSTTVCLVELNLPG